MMKIPSRAVLLAAVMCGMFAQAVPAYEAGDIIVRMGATTTDPTGESSNTFRLNGALLPGTEVDEIDSSTRLGVTGTYMFTKYFGLELLAAWPFEHTIKAKGLESLDIRKVGDTKQLPPTLSAQFYPMGLVDSASRFQPYLGLGLNYTIFFDENASSQLERGLSTVTGVNEKYSLDVDNSWGLAAQVGLDFTVTDRFLVSAELWWINIEADAKLKGKQTGTEIKADDVEVNPLVYMFSVGYRF